MKNSTIWRFTSLIMAVALVIGLIPGIAVASAAALQKSLAKPERIAIGAMTSAGDHLRPPARDVLMEALIDEGLPLNATPEQIKAAEEAWFKNFQKHSRMWVNPKQQEWVLQREQELASPDAAAKAAQAEVAQVTATIFSVAVDFGATDTFTVAVDDGAGGCVDQSVSPSGPLQGLIANPGPLDNQTIWYSATQTADPNFYEKLMGGYEGVGRVRPDTMVDPDDGLPGINLAGYTMQDFFDNFAGPGNVLIDGNVYDEWVTVNHSEGWYGVDNCYTGSHYSGNVDVATLVIDTLDKMAADHPEYWTDPDFWPQFDANGDGVIDNFAVIHAGADDAAGGGAEGMFAIWSHSSDLRYRPAYPNGYKVYEGDAGTTADDVYVGPYTMQPENLDLGVLVEEFGHNYFGLPDLYTTDYQGSNGDWNTMEGGSWMGWLGGATGVGMPLWFRMIAAYEVGGNYYATNWHQPMVYRDYDDPLASITIGALEKTPAGVLKGVRVNLPQISEVIPNPLGSGKAAYSGTGRSDLDIWLTQSLAVPASGANILTFATSFNIEEDWDYGYLTVDGAPLADMDGITTNFDPNSQNQGNGLTGVFAGTLRYDLSPYAGTTITLGLHYWTDAAVTNPGWWVDDVMLDSALIDDFEAATEPGTFPGWSNTDPGWYVVPTMKYYNSYYLVEWRAKTHFDKMVKTAYVFNTISPDWVSRIPYNVPAALVYYRNTKFTNTYSISPQTSLPPSYGPKYQLLIVDQNWTPMRLSYDPTSPRARNSWSGRISSYDAGLTLQDAEAFTIPAYYGYPTWPGQDYDAKPFINHFNDTQNYYSGFYYDYPCPAGYICSHNRYDSTVIPARGLYSVRISDYYQNPYYGLYPEWPYWAAGFAPSWLGSGAPGDDNVQYGLNVKLISKTGDDAYNSKATLVFYNYSLDFLWGVTGQFKPTGYELTYTTEIRNVGVEDARDVEYYQILYDPLYMINVNVVGPAGPVAFTQKEGGMAGVQPKPDMPNYSEVHLVIGDIPARQRVWVTVTARVPWPLYNDMGLYSDLYGYDGQIVRGLWLVDYYPTDKVIYLPFVKR